MAISMQKARTLCTQAELNLIKWSSPKQVKTLTASRIKQKLDRARKLRDKFQDLARQQAGEARGKRTPTGTRAAKGNQRTVEKVELFNETIARFETALKRAETSESKAAEAKAKKTKASAKKTRTSKKATGKNSKSSKSTSKAESKPAAAAPKAARPVRSASITAESRPSFLDGFGSSLAQQQSREVRRQNASKSSKGQRESNRFSRTSSEKIQGHVSASTRRSQAKRDSK